MNWVVHKVRILRGWGVVEESIRIHIEYTEWGFEGEGLANSERSGMYARGGGIIHTNLTNLQYKLTLWLQLANKLI